MPISVAAPPQQVQAFSGFDYVTVDEAHHRAYAAHTPSKRLLIVDTLSGRVLGQVDVGPMHGVVVDPRTAMVFTGNGTDQTISEINPTSMAVVTSVDVPGNIDAMAFDNARERIYADQDGGGNVYVIDGATMKQIGTIAMPADDLESPAVDQRTGTLYQNLANGGGYAIVDPTSLKVVKVVKTPQLEKNHPLVFAQAANQVIVGGINGIISAYTPDGTHVGDATVQPHIDQCSTGNEGRLVVCAGHGIVSLLRAQSGMAPRVLGKLNTGHAELHTVGIDERTGAIWVVYSDGHGDWVQKLRWSP